MSDPTLTRFSLDMGYTASDGYSMKVGYASGKQATPEAAILDALDELTRIAALFGYGDQAAARSAAAIKRVADWRASRTTAQGAK